MVISVLIPARGRPDYLKRSVASLLDLAAHPDDVEVMIGTDTDEPPSLELVGRRARTIELRCERRGYQMLHVYYNELAAASTGAHLLLWNDDAEMLTKGWDALLADGPAFSIQSPRRSTVQTTDWTFPAMGRPVYEAMGHFALNPYNDAYVSHVALFSRVAVARDDVVFDHHCLKDQTTLEQGSAGIIRFHNPEEIAMRSRDIAKVVRAPGYETRFDGFNVVWRGKEGLSLPRYKYVVGGQVMEPDVAVCTRVS